MTGNPAYRLLLHAGLFWVWAFSLAFAQPTVRKNLSVNKNDVIDSLWKLQAQKTYPHAQSNSECRGEPWFRARCAINDTVKNTGHGQGFPSWGPEQVAHPWLLVDFGKQVVVDSVVIFIRADFPHDGYWNKGRLIFSDNTGVNITLDSTAKPQSFKISPHVTTFLRVDSLVWHVPNTWCALTQVQAFGYDNVSAITSSIRGRAFTKGNSKYSFLCIGFSPLNGEMTDASDYALYDLNGREIRLFSKPFSYRNPGPGRIARNWFVLRGLKS
jgi:hypothetical protein